MAVPLWLSPSLPLSDSWMLNHWTPSLYLLCDPQQVTWWLLRLLIHEMGEIIIFTSKVCCGIKWNCPCSGLAHNLFSLNGNHYIWARTSPSARLHMPSEGKRLFVLSLFSMTLGTAFPPRCWWITLKCNFFACQIWHTTLCPPFLPSLLFSKPSHFSP